MPSIKRILASDETGNASQPTVTVLRSPGATSLTVDTVAGIYAGSEGFYASMGTPHTFTDPITGETLTVISEATAVDFRGHIDTGHIIIDEIAPGYTDTNGSKVGDIVVIRPTTQWANNIGDTLAVSLNDDGTLKNGAITTNSQFVTALDPVQRASDIMYDFVASGVVLAGSGYGSTLGWTLSAGVVYINGKRLTYAGGSGNVTASKDTYFDLLDNGDGTVVLVNTGGNIVANNAASPALAANSIRVGIVVSGASNIASVASINQGQENKVLPIASSIPYAVTDSLGNLICPRDPNRKVLGQRQITSNSSVSATSDTAITGLSMAISVPAGRKIKVSISAQSLAQSSNTTGTISIYEGASLNTLTTLKGSQIVFCSGSSINVPLNRDVTYTPSSSTVFITASSKTNNNANATVVTATSTDPIILKAELA